MQNSGKFSVSALDEGEWSALHMGRFTPRKWAPVPTAHNRRGGLHSRSGHFTPSGNQIRISQILLFHRAF